MDIDAQVAKAQAFRKLHNRSRLFLLPNAWDAVTARLFEQMEFPAIATTSGGIAWSLGYADGERAPLDEVLAAIRRIARAVTVPVTADIESGYGTTPEEVGSTIRAVLEAGAVGVNLEDGAQGSGGLRDMAAIAERIQAARTAADAVGIPLVINARVDTYLAGYGEGDSQRFDETVRRARAYLAAGADCIFPITLSDGPTLQALVAAIDAPVNVAARPGLLPLAELEQLGIARVSTASHLTTVALAAAVRALTEIRETGRFDVLQSELPRPELQRLMGG